MKRCSIHGHAYSTAEHDRGNRTPAEERVGDDVCRRSADSKFGISRSAPISQPRYQSGCAPFVAGQGSYGPHCQIGLIWTSPPSSTSTAATAASQPSERSA